MALPTIADVKYESECLFFASFVDSVVDTATSLIPPLAAVALISESVIDWLNCLFRDKLTIVQLITVGIQIFKKFGFMSNYEDSLLVFKLGE